MHEYLTRRRDFLAGGLVMLLGLGAAYAGSGYEVGTLQKMGPGFFPLALGVLLIFLGVAIAGSAAVATGEDDEHTIPARAEWRGWLCIAAGPLLFVVLGHYGGLVPATFSCVFVAALGDRSATLKSSLLLAAGITVLGVVLFSTILGVPLPAFRWTSA
jgi:putative Ca2+/H+ antiporter (TMEM165/GDT1 family)